MATLQELRNSRLNKLEKLKELGINPYPAKSFKDINNSEILQNFEKLEGKDAVISGRIVSLRRHGKLVFMDLKDSTGKIQLFIKEDRIKKANHKSSELDFEDLELLDTGDFAEGFGKVIKTQTGEISVGVETLRILGKSIRPMPDSWDGLKDKEVRLRRRYLDTSMNGEVYDRFVRRAKFWETHREFFKENGFLEMNIPVLEQTPGGADAKPFVTHMDAIDQDLYLRISQELYLKRLIGGGYPKVFEIGPRFRNEGLSDEHLPEHMAMEFYWAYANWEEGMEFVKKQFDIDVVKTSVSEIEKVCEERGIRNVSDKNLHRSVDNLWKELRKTVAGPTFLINHPKYLSPLAKANAESPHITERFQPIIAGSELGNGWSEINDPQDQLERFKEQQGLRELGDDEAQWLDIDYVEMLEYGMPPTFGYGHSERIFWFLEDVSA